MFVRFSLLTLLFTSLTLASSTLHGLKSDAVKKAIGEKLLKDYTAHDVMKLANLRTYYSGKDRVSAGHITVTEPNGTVRIRDYQMLRRDKVAGGNQSYFVYFTKPKDLQGTSFLVHKKPGSGDDRWLYLPKLDLVRRIAPGDKRTHFVGTDLFYEDVSGRHLEDDLHTFAKGKGHKKYWIVKSRPKSSGSVEFDHYKSWVHRKTHLVIKREYYKRSGKMYRKFLIKKVRDIGGIPSSVKTVIKDLAMGTTTVINCLSIAYKQGIPEKLFAERFLRNPDFEWLNRSETNALD
jgi:hypothetical protein